MLLLFIKVKVVILKVFLVLPKKGRILSRELIYTALTRAKDNLTILIEGDNPNWIFNYSKPDTSETARRNSHLFITSVRESRKSIPLRRKFNSSNT